MSAPTDTCADPSCGHDRSAHTGGLESACRASPAPGQFCGCPAFDEGAPKLERSDANGMATALRGFFEPLRNRFHDGMRGVYPEQSVARENERALDRALAAMEKAVLEACAQPVYLSRIQAAERAVVEAAERWGASYAGNEARPYHDETSVISRMQLFEHLNRLRAERARVEAEECGAEALSNMTATSAVGRSAGWGDTRRVRCTKPRGHVGNGDPEHEGELGKWVWR